MKKTIAVWFSCGAPSAVAAAMTLDKYGNDYEVLIINNPVKEEGEDNIRFKNEIGKWLGVEIISANNEEYPDNSAQSVWKKRAYMSGIKGAPCTKLLKKEARYQFEKSHNIAFHVLGFTLEEMARQERFNKMERENTLPVLIDLGITRDMCFRIIEEAGIQLPLAYRQGYPNANCKGCVKATSPTYWNHVRMVDGNVFAERAIQSRELGVRLVRYKKKRLFLDELPADAKGRKMKSHECGIFCDTK